ncbi:MAG: hypothetical protein AB199_03195 [Parcubacteria bacterium C7867-004]|nr:MAG: hypothetical protein AB199_03195 [Parcubacteria bacterium C7867-004]
MYDKNYLKFPLVSFKELESVVTNTEKIAWAIVGLLMGSGCTWAGSAYQARADKAAFEVEGAKIATRAFVRGACPSNSCVLDVTAHSWGQGPKLTFVIIDSGVYARAPDGKTDLSHQALLPRVCSGVRASSSEEQFGTCNVVPRKKENYDSDF